MRLWKFYNKAIWTLLISIFLVGYQNCGDGFKVNSITNSSSIDTPSLLPHIKTGYPKIMSINIANPARYSDENYI
ncbi:MAG: hypothetical protein A4S09_06060 [Proteobacteria bacterium SG_bin7]|nr:MAG: hypothetical protein A4S09_06060 [Proteobacteria bacterium SG_bin7]